MTEPAAAPRGVLQKWNAMPLYLRIVFAMAAGVLAGAVLGEQARVMEIPSTIVLQLLGALAPPLILVAVTHVLMTTEIRGKVAGRLCGLLLINTTVAIVIGLTVANLMKPGRWNTSEPQQAQEAGTGDESGGATPVEQSPNGSTELAEIRGTLAALQQDVDGLKQENVTERKSPVELLAQNVPHSVLGPLGDKQNIIGVILIAVAFGLALRGIREKRLDTVENMVEAAYHVLLTVLHWIINLVPIGVFAIVASVVGVKGFGAFASMGAFVLAVVVALLLQTVWYLVRIRFFSWARPIDVLRGMRDALFMAFSTDSSTATMPVTYACLKDKVGVREESASMGALVGANFNNDGTALYEAMAALFIAQTLGQHLTLSQQLIVVVTSIIASVGAAGIPEAGLVTMTLVFSAVGLPIKYIALLLTVDWFLDRCRTTINVLGDVNVSCLLDGRERPDPELPETPAEDESTGKPALSASGNV